MAFLIRGDGSDALRKLVLEATEVKAAEVNWRVGSDHWLDNVLNIRWLEYKALLEEIDKKADSAEKKAPIDLETWRERLVQHNPDADQAEIEREARMLSLIDEDRYERVSSKFVGRIMALYTEVTILSAALCEAEINLALEWGCAVTGKPELFTLVDSCKTSEKWLHGPKLFFTDYKFPPGSAEAETLARVFSERNRLMHARATVEVDGKKNERAKKYKVLHLADALMWLPRYFSLPFDLVDFLKGCPPVNGYKFPVLSHREKITRASAHRLV